MMQLNHLSQCHTISDQHFILNKTNHIKSNQIMLKHFNPYHMISYHDIKSYQKNGRNAGRALHPLRKDVSFGLSLMLVDLKGKWNWPVLAWAALKLMIHTAWEIIDDPCTFKTFIDGWCKHLLGSVPSLVSMSRSQAHGKKSAHGYNIYIYYIWYIYIYMIYTIDGNKPDPTSLYGWQLQDNDFTSVWSHETRNKPC